MIDSGKHKSETAFKIKLLRKLHRLSQTQAAVKLRISRDRYHSYESGHSITPFYMIEKICDAYEITVEKFRNLKIVGNVSPKTPNEWKAYVRRNEKIWRLHASQ